MARKETFTFPSVSGGTEIHGVRYIPEGEIRGVLQISHGMVEYIERYEDFACYLADRGILVTGNDHLGHGGSIGTKEDYGYFAEPDGNGAVLADLIGDDDRPGMRLAEAPGKFTRLLPLRQHGLSDHFMKVAIQFARRVLRPGQLRLSLIGAADIQFHPIFPPKMMTAVSASSVTCTNHPARSPVTPPKWLYAMCL